MTPKPRPPKPEKHNPPAPSEPVRLQKYLADFGVGSRREIERWIVQGRITLDNRLAVLGDRVTPESLIRIDYQTFRAPKSEPRRSEVLLYHKPEGLLTARFDSRFPVVFQDLPPAPHGSRWIAIGRLDLNSSGLLCFTNNGELAHRAMHPSSQIQRVYWVRLHHCPDPDTLKAMTRGLVVDGERLKFDAIERLRGDPQGTNQYLKVSLKTGRNREVRRLFEAVGAQVSRLKRLSFGPFELPKTLKERQWIDAEEAKVEAFMKELGLELH